MWWWCLVHESIDSIYRWADGFLFSFVHSKRHSRIRKFHQNNEAYRIVSHIYERITRSTPSMNLLTNYKIPFAPFVYAIHEHDVWQREAAYVLTTINTNKCRSISTVSVYASMKHFCPTHSIFVSKIIYSLDGLALIGLHFAYVPINVQ